MTTYRFRKLTDEQVANWHNTSPAARKAAILEEMGMDSRKINAASQAKHEREHLQQGQPKEPRYRRKPLEWVDDDAKSHRTNTPIGHFFVDYVCQRWVITWSSGMTLDTAPTLEQAKARVEAEITRRLASVLEVCDE